MTDKGTINFDTDWRTATVKVSVREPLAINASKTEISVVDFLEVAARVQLEMCEHMRAAQQQMLKQLAGKPA